MSENAPSNPQFVGQADATRSREALPKDEFVLNAEQKQVVEVMQSAGKELETAELDAREKAAGELKQLHGKELVDAGLKQMGHGVWETVKGEIKGIIGGGLRGGIGGAIGFGIIGMTTGSGENAVALAGQGAGVGSLIGATVGGVLGYETAGIKYNRTTAIAEKLPLVRWYDWISSHGSGFLLNLLIGRVAKNPITAARASFAVSQVINPISVGGIRNVVKGLWEMRKGS